MHAARSAPVPRGTSTESTGGVDRREAFALGATKTSGWSRRWTSRPTSRKDAQKVRLVGRVQTTLEVGLRPVPRAVPDAGRCAVRPDVPAGVRRTRGCRTATKEVEDDDVGVSYYKDDAIDLGEVMREQFFLALPMKPLCRDGLPGAVSGVRRSTATGETCECRPSGWIPRLAGSEELLKRTNVDGPSDAESQTTTLEDAHRQAPHARRAEAGRRRRVSAVPRAEAAAPGVPELRLLPRPAGPSRRRRLVGSAGARVHDHRRRRRDGRRPGARARSWPARCRPRVTRDLSVALVGPPQRSSRASWRATLAAPDASITHRRRAGRRSAWTSRRSSALRRKPRVLGPRRRRAGGAAARRRRSSAPATRARRSSRRTRRSACCRASNVRRWPSPCRRATGAAILLDAGANLDCRPEHLVQFARAGRRLRARRARHRAAARSGCSRSARRPGKGNDLIREAHALLERAPVDFIGNLEAREFFTGRADVIVCDGFTGNIALKVGEGLVEAAEEMLREELGAELVSQIGALLDAPCVLAVQAARGLRGVRRRAAARARRRWRSSATAGRRPQAVENGIAMAARLAEQRHRGAAGARRLRWRCRPRARCRWLRVRGVC